MDENVYKRMFVELGVETNYEEMEEELKELVTTRIEEAYEKNSKQSMA
jgi:hypothetical protein